METHQVFNHHIGIPLDEFVNKNKRLAFKIANRYKNRAEKSIDDIKDYEQICFVGLVKAYHRYDPTKFPDKRIKPTTYAVEVMKSELTTYLRDKSYIIRYPREFSLVWSRVRKLGLEDEKDLHAVAKAIGMNFKWVREAMKYFDAEQPISLQTTYHQHIDDREEKLEDLIGRYGDFSVIYVNDFIDTLNARDRLVLELLLKDIPKSEIASIVGVVGSSVSRIIKRISKKLQEYYSL